MGRLIKQHHIVGHHEIIGTVEACIVGLNDVKIMWVAFGKVMEKLLKIFGIHSIVLLNHPLARQGLHDAIKIKRFELPLSFDGRLDSMR